MACITDINSLYLLLNIFFTYLIRQLYINFGLIYKTNRIGDFSILLKIIFITAPILNLCIFSYNLATKILYMIYLYFIKN